nr:aldo/keto reductase [[Pseudopropionibacterium] massiliense]
MAPVNLTHDRAAASVDESLRLLGTDYIDLMLLHQPIADYPGAYRALEEAYRAGKLRAIGVSNFYPDRLADIALLTEVPPMVNQVETHPFRQNAEAHELMTSLGVIHKAWVPFAEGRNGIFTDPVLTAIGAKYGKTAGQVTLRALIQQDVIVIPKSTHRNRMEENLDVFDFELGADDMAAFAALDDGSFPRIFDHRDPTMIAWLVSERIRKADPSGAALY